MATLAHDGATLYFEIHGSGPAILLTHGFSATSRMWKPQIAELSRDHTLILWDMRGHGRTRAPATPEAYAEARTVGDIAALLDHAGVGQSVIGGLSLGGYMSLAFALTHPTRVRGLVITDTGPGYKRDDKRAAWNTDEALPRADAIAARGVAALEDGSVEMREAVHHDVPGLELAARHMLTQHSPHVINGLPAITAPTLVMVGADDTPYLGATDYMAHKIPNASKVVIPDAGHAANLDQPAAFNRAVRTFLDAHSL